MSDFGDFSSSNDPTADFLARERAVLGGDADIFTTLDNSGTPIPSFTSPSASISGLETPDLLSTTENYTTSSSFSPQYANSLVTTTTTFNQQGTADYSSVFESNYPKAENLESSHAFHKALLPEEEPDVVRQWHQKHKEAIAKRDEDEANLKQQVLNRAREEIDRFYEEYNDKKQKAIEENREREQQNLKNREMPTTANIWTSVVREVDINDANKKVAYPTRDVSRMKSILLDLKKDANAPGTIIKS